MGMRAGARTETPLRLTEMEIRRTASRPRASRLNSVLVHEVLGEPTEDRWSPPAEAATTSSRVPPDCLRAVVRGLPRGSCSLRAARSASSPSPSAAPRIRNQKHVERRAAVFELVENVTRGQRRVLLTRNRQRDDHRSPRFALLEIRGGFVDALEQLPTIGVAGRTDRPPSASLNTLASMV